MGITKRAMLVAVVVGLLAMVQQSVQMSDDTSSMLRESGNDLSYWAIVFSRKTSERTILDSGDFDLTDTEVIAGRVFRTGTLIDRPVVLVNTGKYSIYDGFGLAGRVFRTGTLIDRPVVLVNTGKYSANVASALQIALSHYRIRGVLYLGLAGGLIGGRALSIGSVIIPKSVAFTAIWDWLSLDANPAGDLVFGNFNEGENLQNELGSVKFNNVTLYTGQNNVSYPFYLKTDEEWMAKALDIKVQLPDIPIHVGFVGASSDMKISNKAYGLFLYKRFGFEAVDQESATVALVSKSNDKPYMVFHGVSNIAISGVPATDVQKQKAAKNAYRTLKAFLSSLPGTLGHLTAHV